MTKSLESKTLAFWKLSSVWRGRGQTKMTTEKGLKVSREILMNTGPQRLLVTRVDALQQRIIDGKEPANERSAND